MPVNWEQLLTVDAKAVADLFVTHAGKADPKLCVRGYTIPFAGTQQSPAGIIECLRRQLLKYVFPESSRPADIDWALARDKFGDNDPESDGKLGEMLLYIFVEAFLKAPLMAYKLKDLGNPNDQVKGADGVFVGEYAGHPALLIGESKIHKSLESAISSTLESLHRFHGRPTVLSNELMIARKYPAERNLDPEVLEAVHGVLTGKANYILIHPVFISYNCDDIARICTEADCAENAEAALAKHIVSEASGWAKTIENQKPKYGKPFQVYLDFFFFPVEDCLQLRHAFYEMLHGHPYESGAVKSAVKRVKQELKAAASTKAKPAKKPKAKATSKPPAEKAK